MLRKTIVTETTDRYTFDQLPENATPANVLYEGGVEEHEDIADYLPRGTTIKGTVIA